MVTLPCFKNVSPMAANAMKSAGGAAANNCAAASCAALCRSMGDVASVSPSSDERADGNGEP